MSCKVLFDLASFTSYLCLIHRYLVSIPFLQGCLLDPLPLGFVSLLCVTLESYSSPSQYLWTLCTDQLVICFRQLVICFRLCIAHATERDCLS